MLSRLSLPFPSPFGRRPKQSLQSADRPRGGRRGPGPRLPSPASLPPEAHLYSEQALGELLKPRLRSGAFPSLRRWLGGAAEVSQWLSRSPSCPDWKASEVTWAVLPYFRNDTLEETTAFPKVHSVADRTGGRASCTATVCMITNTPGTVQ